MEEEEDCYENSNPDTYATSVYSCPHWMFSFEGSNNRRNPWKFSRSYDSTIRVKVKVQGREDIPICTPSKIPSVAREISESRNTTVGKRSKQTVPSKIKQSRTTSKVKVKGVKRKLTKAEKQLSYEEQIVSLFCNHCKMTFKAKPTYRRRFNHTLVNHSCSGSKRRQYVLGVKRRKCLFACSSVRGCIYRLPDE